MRSLAFLMAQVNRSTSSVGSCQNALERVHYEAEMRVQWQTEGIIV